jgi:hypothetical protein
MLSLELEINRIRLNHFQSKCNLEIHFYLIVNSWIILLLPSIVQVLHSVFFPLSANASRRVLFGLQRFQWGIKLISIWKRTWDCVGEIDQTINQKEYLLIIILFRVNHTFSNQAQNMKKITSSKIRPFFLTAYISNYNNLWVIVQLDAS